MIGKTNDKNVSLNLFENIVKNELEHIKHNLIIFLVCFLIARQNIIHEIFPFAIIAFSVYSFNKGASLSLLIITILAVLSVNFNFVYIIILLAVYAYFYKKGDKSILSTAGYSAMVLLVSKTTILLADGFSKNGLILNIFETFFIFSAIILSNEAIKFIKGIRSGTKKININRLKSDIKKSLKLESIKNKDNNLNRENGKHIRNEAATTAAPAITNIDEYKKSKHINIFSEKAKVKIKEQLLWQNINIKFFEVVSYNKNSIILSLTVKTEKSSEEAESAIELIVRNVSGVKLKCTERIIASPNYYVFKFKNIKRIKIRTYSATATKDGSIVSGDNFAHAARADKYYTVLCDGIGSGEEACSESNGAVELLSKFLYTDFTEEQILRTLNSILMLKLGDERFVTFDLNIIDYGSKEMRVYKAGAAPTYIISNKNVDKISGKSLPLGILDNFEYSSFKKNIHIGDIIIMVSDGITDSISMDEKKNLDKYLELLVKRDPQTIANSILSYALRGQASVIDDMTVLVTKVG
ncbi:SpoIIE family protein phosphatase [Sedimentibacter sp.]|uniref:SpoIIE family protein phosphatase n=1 Tax=Sedimentibacter sp. TaxID=1960295 RepID=UPI0028B0721D|nr:SpoIIE family protein phosphatase [Sedimentibacter sp.]